MQININNIFYYLLGIFMVSFIVPSYSFNTQCMIAVVFWSIFLKDSWTSKLNNFKQNKINILIISIPFILSLIGLLYTDNSKDGLKNVINNIPFLFIPLSLLTLSYKYKIINYCLNIFTGSIIFFNLMIFSYVFYLKVNYLGNFFYYDQYGLFFGKHTTYIALFICIAIGYLSFLIKNKIKNKITILYYLSILFLLVQVYFLSVRIAIISIFINLIFLIFNLKYNKIKLITIPILVVIAYSIFSLPNFKKRFLPSMTEIGQKNGLSFRAEHWQSVLETIKHNNAIIGAGTGSDRTFLYEQYRDKKLTSAYIDEYNAHNQFLEFMLEYGLIGITLFLTMLIYLYYKQIQHKNTLGIIILNTFVVFFITESVLVRQSGIILFSTLASLIILSTQYPTHFGKNKTI